MGDTSNLLSDELEDDEEGRDSFDAESGNDHLKPRSAFTPWPHVFNLANCIVGVSVLAMPFVFQQCGILLATIMIGASSVLTKYTCHFLAKAAYLTNKRSYEALALTALGPTGRRIIELCLLGFLVSSIVAFLVVIGDLGPHIVADYLELEAPTQRLRTLVMVVVMLFIIFPLCLIKDLEKFSVISSCAVLFYSIFVTTMVLEALPTLWDGKWSIHVVWWRPEGFLTCMPIVFMGLACQVQLFCVIDCIHDSLVARVDSVVSGAVNFCSALYAGVGLFGYVAFYSRTLHGDVLIELEASFFTQLLKMAFLLSVAVSIPLMMFPARSALFNLVLRPVYKKELLPSYDVESNSKCELPVSHAMQFSTFHVLTFVILLFNMTIALLIPNVEFILGLTGASIGSLVSIVIPSILYLAVAKNRTHYTISYAKVCLLAGLFIWCASTWATLHVDRTVHVAEKPMPKDGPVDKPALQSLQKLEEKVLDANLNISAKLDNIADLAAVGKDKEAAHLLVEMKEERKKQEDLIRKQEKIVEELHKHVEEHEKAEKEKKAAEAKVTKEPEKTQSENLFLNEGEVKKENASAKNDMKATKKDEKREAVDDKIKNNFEEVKREEAKDIQQNSAVEKVEVEQKAKPNEGKIAFESAAREETKMEPVISELKDIPSKELPKNSEVTLERIEKQPEPVKNVQNAKPQKNASLPSKPVEAQNEEPLKNIVPVSGQRQSEVPKIGLEALTNSLEHNVRGDI